MIGEPKGLSLFPFMISGSLTDEHVLELSKRIVSESELMDLGINVLGHPEHVILTAIYDNRDKIQPATHEILSRWLKTQNNRREAFINLCAGLRKCEMNQLAIKLKEWVEETATRASGTTKKPSVVAPSGQKSSTSAAPSFDQSLPSGSVLTTQKAMPARKGSATDGKLLSSFKGARPKQLPPVTTQQRQWKSKTTKTTPCRVQKAVPPSVSQKSSTSAAPKARLSQWKSTAAQKGASPRGKLSSSTKGARPRQLPPIANEQGRRTSANTKNTPSGKQ